MTVFGLQYFNGGLKYLFGLATMDLFKNYYELEPTQGAIYSSMIMIPWAIKFIYGIVSDTIPLFGSRKKSWLLIMALI